MLARPLVSIAGNTLGQTPGVLQLTQKKLVENGNADITYSLNEISNGVLLRSTFASPSVDKLPSAKDIFAAFKDFSIGDSFELTIVNAAGGAATLKASDDGSTILDNNSYATLAANFTFWCIFTALSENCQPTSFAVTATNGSKVLTPENPDLLASLGVGMGVSVGGTDSTITGINLQNGTVTMADDFGGTTGSGQAASFSPRVNFLAYTTTAQS